MKGIHFDYRMMLEPWIAAVPGAELVLRPYDRVLAAGGSVADFLAWSGLAEATGLPPPGAGIRINAGLHRGVIELARRANAVLAPLEAMDTYGALLRLGPLLDLPPSAEVELYGAESRERLATRFAPIHDWLSERIGAPFFADAERIGMICPHPEPEVNRAAMAGLGARGAELPAAARALFDGLDLTPNFS
jgi:hypothetical protein